MSRLAITHWPVVFASGGEGMQCCCKEGPAQEIKNERRERERERERAKRRLFFSLSLDTVLIRNPPQRA